MHALDRLNERYGNRFTIADVNKISVLIKKGLCLEIVNDFVDRDRITVLLRYNKIPLKIIYSKTSKRVVTVLPLDIDEYNEYFFWCLILIQICHKPLVMKMQHSL